MLLAPLRPENAVCVCAHRWTQLFCYEASAGCPRIACQETRMEDQVPMFCAKEIQLKGLQRPAHVEKNGVARTDRASWAASLRKEMEDFELPGR